MILVIMVDQVLPNLTAKRKSDNTDTTPLPASHLASPTPRYQQEAVYSINYPLHVSKNAIYYILSTGRKAMNGLKWKEWDMISGGLEAFICNEEDWLTDERPEVVKSTEETIEKLNTLMRKVEVIKRKLWRTEMGMTR